MVISHETRNITHVEVNALLFFGSEARKGNYKIYNNSPGSALGMPVSLTTYIQMIENLI